MKQPPEPASRSNYVWKDHKSEDFSAWSGTKQTGLLHVKRQNSENIRKYPELYL